MKKLLKNLNIGMRENNYLHKKLFNSDMATISVKKVII